MKDTVVIGLGNPLMSDEGVGVHLAQQLTQNCQEFPEVDVLDLGTSGMAVVHAIAGRRKAVLIDCAFMGESPGTIHRFVPDEVRSTKSLTGFTFHEGDLLSMLDISRQVGEHPEEVVIFGVEPEQVGPGTELSRTLQDRMQDYERTIVREL